MIYGLCQHISLKSRSPTSLHHRLCQPAELWGQSDIPGHAGTVRYALIRSTLAQCWAGQFHRLTGGRRVVGDGCEPRKEFDR